MLFITKTDTMDFFDFNMELAKEHIMDLNPNAVIFPVSAKTGEGLDKFADWIRANIAAVKAGKKTD